MNTRCLKMVFITLVLSYGLTAIAQPPPVAQEEIEYLLNFVETSDCDFYRNGTWHDPVEAQEHLRKKYQYLSAKNRIETAEEFIEKTATKSSLSGRAYEIRCGECPNLPTAEWLHSALLRYRVDTAGEQPLN